MSAGKGMAPRAGYNWKGYGDKYDAIFRKPSAPQPARRPRKPPLRPIPATLPPKSPPESP